MPPLSLLWSCGPFRSAFFPPLHQMPVPCAMLVSHRVHPFPSSLHVHLHWHAMSIHQPSAPIAAPSVTAPSSESGPHVIQCHWSSLPSFPRCWFFVPSSLLRVLTSPTPVWNSVPCPTLFRLRPYPRYNTRGLFVSASVLAGLAIVVLCFPSISSVLSSLWTSVSSMSPMLKNSRGSFLLGGTLIRHLMEPLESDGPPQQSTLTSHTTDCLESDKPLQQSTLASHTADYPVSNGPPQQYTSVSGHCMLNSASGSGLDVFYYDSKFLHYTMDV
jgi:hypothetical protein